jgi:hypothetical protein
MNNSICLSFQLKISKKDAISKAPIYARININGLRTEFSIKRFVEPGKWVNRAGIVKGNNEETKSLNIHLSTVRTRIYQQYNRFIESGRMITPEVIKNAYFGIIDKGKTIVEVFEYHNAQMKELVNKD